MNLELFGRNTMNCEQIEAIVLDLDRDEAADSLERAAAMAHLSHCPHCAALQESWQAAREELRLLSEETLEAQAPARVEMRLRQEFRTRHRTLVARRLAVGASWTLAAAAILVGAISSWNWLQARHPQTAKQNVATPKSPIGASGQTQTQDISSDVESVADNSAEFTALPGSTLEETEEASIFHVRMQRGSLGALGLPVNEARAGEWIQVDLMVGNDGLPQAVRLAQEEN
jgi:hypothetical protein